MKFIFVVAAIFSFEIVLADKELPKNIDRQVRNNPTHLDIDNYFKNLEQTRKSKKKQTPNIKLKKMEMDVTSNIKDRYNYTKKEIKINQQTDIKPNQDIRKEVVTSKSYTYKTESKERNNNQINLEESQKVIKINKKKANRLERRKQVKADKKKNYRYLNGLKKIKNKPLE